jgi:hypothetical protein
MQPSTLSSPAVISNHIFAEVHLENITNHHSLHALKNFHKGDLICKFSSSRTDATPSRYTVQTGEHKHIILNPEFLQYINHSCDPSVFFDTAAMELVALKNLEAGDEFTFFYPSTEWSMSEPFRCLCRSANCLETISGAKNISDTVLKHYRLTGFIQQKLEETRE